MKVEVEFGILFMSVLWYMHICAHRTRTGNVGRNLVQNLERRKRRKRNRFSDSVVLSRFFRLLEKVII